ncbi:hypothetical protein VNI00_005564 [Paramarasmius palmivorus]|uniref:Transposase n=1 Tax=Paramarasmius palmivorus TaxID=297713 RepID=A0AAW0DDL8_9AGAR
MARLNFDWFRAFRPNQHHVFDVLHFVKAAFKSYILEKLDERDCFNKEAYRFHDSTPSFAALASQSASLSNSSSALFDMDQPSAKSSHGMRFKELDPKVLHEERVKHGLKPWEEESAS